MVSNPKRDPLKNVNKVCLVALWPEVNKLHDTLSVLYLI